MKTKLTLFALLLSIIGYTQNGINYKALIKDDLGNILANQTIDVQFSILQNATTVYQETHATSTDGTGIVIISIGEGTVLNGVFNDINWGDDDHFLRVQIDTGSGFVNLGTTQFMAVPYALKANNVNGLEAIDEGNGIGWRLVGKNPDYYGDIGLNAVDLSYNLTASTIRGATGAYSTTLGRNTIASESYATAMGRLTNASGETATAMGQITQASGNISTAMGDHTVASGNIATALGFETDATGDISLATGAHTLASGIRSTAIGSQTTASGPYSTAMGSNTIALGNYSTAMGRNTMATDYSTAMGDTTEASASYSTAMGRETIASGNVSTAMGNETEASGLRSTAIGHLTVASGGSSTAMGRSTTASGNFSTAIGFNTTASGTYSTAMGLETIASGFISTAIGSRTRAPSFAETVVGVYNTNYTPNESLTWDANDRLFVIGNGESNSRSNAMVVLKNGNIGIGTSTPQELLHISGGRLRIGTETIEDTGSNRLSFNADLLPDLDNTMQLGNSAFRWQGLWATDGTINTSDRREKKNIKNLNYGLAEILQMQPVSFNWKNKNNPDLKLGLIAQDLLKLTPEVVKTHVWETDEITGQLTKKVLDRLGVYYADLVPVLINAIKELKEENNALLTKLNAKDVAFNSLALKVNQIELLLKTTQQ